MKRLVVVGNGMAGVGLRRADPAARADGSTSRFSATKRTSTTTASCCRRCWPARRPPTRSRINPLEWYAAATRSACASASASPTSMPQAQDRHRPTTASVTLVRHAAARHRQLAPVMPPIEGLEKDGVFAFRTLDDTRALLERARPRRQARGHRRRPARPRGGARAAGAGLRRHRRPPDGDADGAPARSRRRQLSRRQDGRRSASACCSATARRPILGNGHVEGVALVGRHAASTPTSSSSAAGIRPNVDLAHKAGLGVNRGIVVNDYMETSAPDIFAVGECVEHRRRLLRPGRAAASSRARCWPRRSPATRARPTPAPCRPRSSRSWASTCSPAGDWSGRQNAEPVRFEDRALGIYKKLDAARRQAGRRDPRRRHRPTATATWTGCASQADLTDAAPAPAVPAAGARTAGLDIAQMAGQRDRSAAASASPRARSSQAIHEQGRQHAVAAEGERRAPAPAAAAARRSARTCCAPSRPTSRRTARRCSAAACRSPQDNLARDPAQPAAEVGAGGPRHLRQRPGLRGLQAGAELHARHALVRRSRRGPLGPLHQRPRPRQHPEGRHVLGRSRASAAA